MSALLQEKLRWFTDLGATFWILFVLGWVMVSFFARDKYNTPTYGKTAIGPLTQLLPRSLAPGSRYLRGLVIYWVGMSVVYMIISFVGPSLVGDVKPPVGSWKDPSIWPMNAAALLVISGVLKDDSTFGKLEYYLRRFAHEQAYIPAAVKSLAYDLRQVDIGSWIAAQGEDAKKALAKMLGKLNPKNPGAEREGHLATWIRANIILYSIDKIRGPNGLAAVRQTFDENKDAYDFIREKHGLVAEKTGRSQKHILQSSRETINLVAEAASLLLASMLWRASRSQSDLGDTLRRYGFPVETSAKFGWSEFALFGGFALTIAAALSFALIFIYLLVVSDIPGVESTGRVVLSEPSLRSLTAWLLYLLIFIFALIFRERSLDEGNWREEWSSVLKFVLKVTLAAGLTASLIMLPLFGGGISQVASILWFNLPIAALAALFFALQMRAAARSSSRGLGHVSGWLDKSNRGALGRAAIHALIACIFGIGFSILVTDRYNNREPKRTVVQLDEGYKELRPKLVRQTGQPSSGTWFLGKYAPAEANLIQRHLSAIDQNLTNWPVRNSRENVAEAIAKTKEVCDRINEKLAQGEELFSEDCATVDLTEHPKVEGAREFVEFGRDLQKLHGQTQQLHWYIGGGLLLTLPAALMSGIPSLCMALLFSLGVYFGRVQQLQNQADRSVQAVVNNLREEVKKADRKVDFDNWKLTPLSSIAFITPHEAIRYERYKSKLFDAVDEKRLN